MAKLISADSPDLQLLVKACFSPESVSKEDFNEVNLQRLVTLAQWHGVRNILYAGLSRELIPDPLYLHLHGVVTKSTFQSLFQTNALMTLLGSLAKEHIPSYTYKGVVWSQWLYGDLNSRSSGDIDLLVPKAYIPQALEVAMQLGYRMNDYWVYLLNEAGADVRAAFFRTDYHIPLTHPDGVVLEVHWQPAYTRLAFSFPDKEWEIWKKDIALQKWTVTSFQNEYQLLLLIMHHGGKERWSQLKYIADLVAYLHRYSTLTNWELVFRLAKEKGMENLVNHALSLVQDLIPNPAFELPVFKQVESNREAFLQQWIAMESLPENSTWPYLKHGLQMRDGLQYRFQVAKEHLKYFTEVRLLKAKAKWYQSQPK